MNDLCQGPVERLYGLQLRLYNIMNLI